MTVRYAFLFIILSSAANALISPAVVSSMGRRLVVGGNKDITIDYLHKTLRKYGKFEMIALNTNQATPSATVTFIKLESAQMALKNEWGHGDSELLEDMRE